MYHRQDVDATPYNPTDHHVAFNCAEGSPAYAGLHCPEVFWLKRHVHTIAQLFHFMNYLPVLPNN